MKLTIDTSFSQKQDEQRMQTTPLIMQSNRRHTINGESGVIRRRGLYSAAQNEYGPHFNATQQFAQLFDSADHQVQLTATVNARMEKGFFMTNNEWTCYRRNYF